MGAQCCVNDRSNNGGATLVEVEGAPDDKTTVLSDDPKVIDQSVASPAPSPVQAAAEDQATETKPEPVVEPVEETKQEETKPDGMPMVFRNAQGEDKTVYIKRKPLGLVFTKSCPIKISGFKDNSHGQEVGVEKEWTLRTLNGDDFTNITEFNQAMDLMKKHVDTLPSSS